MAASRSYRSNSTYRLFDTHAPVTHDSVFELDESDVWNTAISSSPELGKPVKNSAASRKLSFKTDRGGAGEFTTSAAASLPVNVPDWSKILKYEYVTDRKRDFEEDDSEDCHGGGGKWIPPHEFLARTRVASFSVHEGAGRTLKGRDLSRVRNAIWEKIGFQD